jgi:hypothetical protein
MSKVCKDPNGVHPKFVIPVHPDTLIVVSFVEAYVNKFVKVLGKAGKTVSPGGVFRLINPAGNVGKLVSFADKCASKIVKVLGKAGKTVSPGGVYRLVNPAGNVGKLVSFVEADRFKVVKLGGKSKRVKLEPVVSLDGPAFPANNNPSTFGGVNTGST